jgi:hypothetical protein
MGHFTSAGHKLHGKRGGRHSRPELLSLIIRLDDCIRQRPTQLVFRPAISDTQRSCGGQRQRVKSAYGWEDTAGYSMGLFLLPLCPQTGQVLQVPVMAPDVRHGTITSLRAIASAEDLSSEAYAISRAHGFDNLRDWCRVLYAYCWDRSTAAVFRCSVGSKTVHLIHHAIDRA